MKKSLPPPLTTFISHHPIRAQRRFTPPGPPSPRIQGVSGLFLIFFTRKVRGQKPCVSPACNQSFPSREAKYPLSVHRSASL